MPKPPSDIKILRAIYDSYYKTFADFSMEDPDRSTKIYVPIRINEIAKKLKVDADIVFGRLYFFLDHKFGYTRDDGAKVHLFSIVVDDDKHCVNMPLLASVLAGMYEEQSQIRWSLGISILSLAIAIASVVVTIVSG